MKGVRSRESPPIQSPSRMEKELQSHSNGENDSSESEIQSSDRDKRSQQLPDEIDSSCSTPYVSAPSSPGRGGGVSGGYFFSAPASPMHFVLLSAPHSSDFIAPPSLDHGGSLEFEFSARFPSSSGTSGSMISADELFLNGQIRPMKLSSHLKRPQILAPLVDQEAEEEDEQEDELRERETRLRNRSVHRRARSLSPLRNSRREVEDGERDLRDLDFKDLDHKQEAPAEATPSESATSSRSSSGRSSKRWIFLMDLLYRSKSEGRGNAKETFWHSISSVAKEKKLHSPAAHALSTLFRDRKKDSSGAPKQNSNPENPAIEMPKQKAVSQTPAKKAADRGKPSNAVGKRRVPQSLHELHYAANRAQMEEMRKKTFLPYRQGLFGCLGFTSKSCGTMNGLAKTLNPVSSR